MKGEALMLFEMYKAIQRIEDKLDAFLEAIEDKPVELSTLDGELPDHM